MSAPERDMHSCAETNKQRQQETGRSALKIALGVSSWRNRAHTRQRGWDHQVGRIIEAAGDGEVEMDLAQLVKTTAYEISPGLIVCVPLVWAVEYGLYGRSFEETARFQRNRWYLPPASNVIAWLGILFSWMYWAGLLLWVFDCSGVRDVLELTEIMVWLLLFFTRAATIGIKYGLLPEEQVEAQYRPHYDPAQVTKYLFARGWAAPRMLHVLHEQVFEALASEDLDLSRCTIDLAVPEAAAKVREQSLWDGSELRQSCDNAEPMELKPTEVTALDLMWRLAVTSIGSELPKAHQSAAAAAATAIPWLMPLIRGLCGLSPMGNTHLSTLACCCFAMPPSATLFSILIFNLVGAHSYKRRAVALERLDCLCGDGLPLRDLLDAPPARHPSPADPPQAGVQHRRGQAWSELPEGAKVRVSLSDPQNLMAVTLLRRVLRQIGRRYHARIDYYSLAIFSVGLITVAVLNLFFVISPSRFEHRLPTDVLLMATSVTITVFVAQMVLQAAKCNEAPRHRKQLQRELLLVSGKLVDYAWTLPAGDPLEREAMAVRDLLTHADSICGYEEEVQDPTMVLNVPASTGTVISSLGLIAAGLVSFIQGALTLYLSGWRYSEDFGGAFTQS